MSPSHSRRDRTLPYHRLSFVGLLALFALAALLISSAAARPSTSTARTGAVLASTQRPVTFSAAAEPSGAPGWRTIPSWYLVGTDDRVIPPAEQRFMAERAHSHTIEVKASHLSMISQPETVTRLIVQAAESLQ